MSRTGWVVGALFVTCVWTGINAAAPSGQQPVTAAALEGAWKLQSLSYNGVPQKAIGFMLFRDGHFSFVTTRERPPLTREVSRKEFDQMSDEEKRLYYDAFGSMTAAAGPYRVEGDEIIYMREAVRTPYLAGTPEDRRSWFEGGRLVQDFMGGGRRQHYVWERVGK